MLKSLLLLFCLLGGVAGHAQTPNFDFEQRTPDGAPVGWYRFGGSGKLTLDSTVHHGGRYALRLSDVVKSDFVASGWRIPTSFEGKSITLTGYLKTEQTGQQPNQYAGLWLRIDGESGALAFDNMQQRGVKGSTDWQQYTITLPLPDKAVSLNIGGLLVGSGTAWFDDLALSVDGRPIEQAPAKVIRLSKAQTDTVFHAGSGIDLNTVSPQQIDNLAVLGKIWGFVKYYHPAVAAGNHNMDAELFRIMPDILNARSTADRSAVLLNWLARFGTVSDAGSRQSNTSQAVHKPDLAWLGDTKLFSAPLRAQLEAIRQARRPNHHYYVSMAQQIGNPEFNHEFAYRHMKTPDAGYRLLSLYRFWNIIHYFFPYKHLITYPLPTDTWHSVLREYIPQFVKAGDSLAYRLTTLSLIGRVQDTHTNLWGDPIIQNQYKGTFFAPVQVRYIERQFVVTNFYNDSLGAKSGLKRGDIIQTIDGTPIATLVSQRQPYYPASNEPTQFRDLSRDLLRGHTALVQLGILRDGQPQTIALNRYTGNQATFNRTIDYGSYPRDSCYQLLHPDVGYLYLGTIKASKLPQIMQTFKDTKGLVIDLRCYPSEFVVFTLGKYLTTPTPFVKFTGGHVKTPGLFTWITSLNVGQRGVDDVYKGKVVVLVNQETQSQAEYTTMAFQSAPGVVVLGSTTAAADGNVSPFELPGGLRTMISGIGVYYPDGRETQRVGVKVDVEYHPTQAGIKAGKDELLERAVSLIRDGK
ncbi:C-terminal processing protease CtpA/Prc [Spirosoma lacussanchae]|uniref:S41 family peptidase n=1 Tax=Spirosoma lacussanchae TaxID=1884249 RepID=UPI001107CA10|nr:S41 family peptidase [Spirosoma lacussanchae]